MSKRIWVVLLTGAMLSVSPSVFAADMMKPGLWEVTTKVEMPGMPFQAQPHTIKHCYTEQEVKENPVPKDNNCKILDMKNVGNKMSWKVECKGEMAGKGEGEMTYQGDSAYEGWSKMQTQGTTVSVKYKAKRLGECK